MSWRNFSIWRGRLPHWRADDVTYFVTFRHSRELTAAERGLLVHGLASSDGRRWDLVLACVLPDRTELLATMGTGPGGEPFELSDVVEKVKSRAGKEIMRLTGERFPPFYRESFDRIVRDEAEHFALMEQILAGPVGAGLAGPNGEYEGLLSGTKEGSA